MLVWEYNFDSVLQNIYLLESSRCLKSKALAPDELRTSILL
jgi:hypothetical protein